MGYSRKKSAKRRGGSLKKVVKKDMSKSADIENIIRLTCRGNAENVAKEFGKLLELADKSTITQWEHAKKIAETFVQKSMKPVKDTMLGGGTYEDARDREMRELYADAYTSIGIVTLFTSLLAYSSGLIPYEMAVIGSGVSLFNAATGGVASAYFKLTRGPEPEHDSYDDWPSAGRS